MRSLTNTMKKRLISFATKTLIALMLFVVVYAPIGDIVATLHTPTAFAQVAGTAAPTTPTAATPAATGNNKVEDSFCTLGGGVSTCIAGIYSVFAVSLTSVFAYIGGYIFSFAVQISLNSVTYSQLFLSSGWASVRDIANMAFIFMLIYIAITIIIEAETSNTMRTLAWVVTMALLINFSFFITRVVVDAGNLLAIQFYNAIPAKQTIQDAVNGNVSSALSALPNSVATSVSSMLPNAQTKDLTSTIMQAVQIQGLIGNNAFKQFNNSNGFLTALIVQMTVYTAVGVIFIILFIIFSQVGLKFLMRAIGLWFVIIVAPLAFAARAISNSSRPARKYYDMWQDALIKYSFYPAIFLFTFLITNSVINAMSLGNGIVPQIYASLSGVSGNSGATMVGLGVAIANVVLRMGIVVIMLWYGLSVADKVISTGNEMARGITGKIGAAVGGATFGMAARLGQRTIGQGAQRFAESATGRRLAATPILSGITRGARAIGGASFDVRGGGLAKAALKQTGITLGKPQEGGFAAVEAARIKKLTAVTAGLKPSALQMEKAYDDSVKNLSKEDREKLEKASKEYSETLAAQKEGTATVDDVKGKRKALMDLKDAIGNSVYDSVIKDAKKRAGAGITEEYAKTLETKSWKNLWGATSHPFIPIPGLYISQSDTQAANQIRGAKNESEQLLSVLRRAAAQSAAGAAAPRPSTTQAGRTGAPAVKIQPAQTQQGSVAGAAPTGRPTAPAVAPIVPIQPAQTQQGGVAGAAPTGRPTAPAAAPSPVVPQPQQRQTPPSTTTTATTPTARQVPPSSGAPGPTPAARQTPPTGGGFAPMVAPATQRPSTPTARPTPPSPTGGEGPARVIPAAQRPSTSSGGAPATSETAQDAASRIKREFTPVKDTGLVAPTTPHEAAATRQPMQPFNIKTGGELLQAQKEQAAKMGTIEKAVAGVQKTVTQTGREQVAAAKNEPARTRDMAEQVAKKVTPTLESKIAERGAELGFNKPANANTLRETGQATTTTAQWKTFNPNITIPAGAQTRTNPTTGQKEIKV